MNVKPASASLDQAASEEGLVEPFHAEPSTVNIAISLELWK
jgi:hypothetical protein